MGDTPNKNTSDRKTARSSQIEAQLIEAQKRKDNRTFLEELAKRIQLAREGKLYSAKQDYSNAIVAYRKFLTITAKAFDVDVGDLRPDLFDEKSRKGEALLISSIAFDFLKILDHLNSPSAKEERAMCHKIFIRFTLNQPFQAFAAENLRKFLAYKRSVKNRGEFWATYNAIKSKKFCVVATWAFQNENAITVTRLRRFRNEKLSRSSIGRALIAFYYENGAKLIPALELVPGSRPLMQKALRLLTKII